MKEPFTDMGKAWGKAGLEWKTGELRGHVMFRYLLDTKMGMAPMQLEIQVWSYRQKEVRVGIYVWSQ